VLEIITVGERENLLRIIFNNGVIEEIFVLDPLTKAVKDKVSDGWIFPAKHYIAPNEIIVKAIKGIKLELQERLAELKKHGKILEAERLARRTKYDLEMIKNIGYCNGIENYSRFFDGRKPGDPPASLLDFFQGDFLTVIDESHVSVPQIRGMYAGDRARKLTLIEHGFRLPSAIDNRPLNFDEFEQKTGQTIYVSATPGEYERENSQQIVEQIVRPTGLVDPHVTVKPVTADNDYGGQIADVIKQTKKRIQNNERVLITTLTKKQAEDLTDYLSEQGIKVQYLHSDVQTLDRVDTISKLRSGDYNVIVGVNLLREGLDLPEVSLVAILDADKEGFLRSETALIQTMGRAARNVNGEVVLYADEITGSLSRAVQETNRRRAIQSSYNKQHGITPKTVEKSIFDIRELLPDQSETKNKKEALDIEYVTDKADIEQILVEKRMQIKQAIRAELFETAAVLRDEIKELEKELEKYER
ncbi:excinuclease ABC subunit B, partial [Candidatus Parcubacteria bacterium]